MRLNPHSLSLFRRQKSALILSWTIMLLRSSSTPVLGSLLSSVSESPNAHFHDTAGSPFRKHCSISKLPYLHHPQAGCSSLTAVSCPSSPLSPSIPDLSGRLVKGFRRAQSDGNLEGLSSTYEQYEPSHAKTVPGRSKRLMLETVPTFSYYGLNDRYEDDENGEESESDDLLDAEEEREIAGAKEEVSRFGISNKTGNLVSTEQVRQLERSWNAGFQDERTVVYEEMFLARGLGIDSGIGNWYGGGGRGGRDSGRSHSSGGDGGDMNQTEEHYKRMIQESPGNPMLLRNYAQFLHQSKGDLPKAEEYYSRAILADPGDGEILSQYAKLVWELHCDEDRALAYFKRAAEAAPDDSYVHASYAGFLWEIDEDEDECRVPNDLDIMPPSFHQGPIASAVA